MPDRLVLHAHQLSLYQRCPAKFRFENSGLKSRVGRVNPRMLYGSLWHAAYVARQTRESLPAALEHVIKDQGLDPDGEALARDLWPEVEQDLEWFGDQSKSVNLKRILWIERPGETLELPIDDGLAICGRPDVVAEVEADWGGGVVILDHKTFVALSETASGPRYSPDPKDATLTRHFHSRQFPFYVGLWNRLHPDQPCETAIVNMVPQRVTHVLAYLETRKGTPKPPYVAREVIPYDPSYCERLVVEAIDTAREIRDKLAKGEEAIWRQHGHSCVEWGDVCPFLEICEAGDQQRQVMIESMRGDE